MSATRPVPRRPARPTPLPTTPAVARPGPRAGRPGFVLVYAMVAMTAFCGICMLAVDLARVHLVKTELSAAADAAARAGVAGLSDGTAYAKAVYIGSQNRADGRPLELTLGGADPDVVLGRWDAAAKLFVPGDAPTNAVRVRARRTAARGGAVPLAFGQILGLTQQDVSAETVAVAVPAVPKYAIVGLDAITMSGVSTSAYRSGTGATSAGLGHIASNGNIIYSGTGYIDGDARPGTGKVVISGAGLVAGSTAPLDAPLSYPNGSAGAAAAANNNAYLTTYMDASGNVSYSGLPAVAPGGVYHLNNISISGSITFTGPVTIYCYGSLNLSGQLVASGNIPSNLRIVMCPSPGGAAPGSVSISGTAALYATIYAPQSTVSKSGGNFYGSIVGRTVSLSGTATYYYDQALGASTPAGVGIVR